MSKKLRIFLPLVLALIMLVALAAPAFAHVAPLGANTNDLQVNVSRPSLTYHIGDHIHYSVTVSVSQTLPPPQVPAYQTKIDTSFDPVSDGTNSDGTGDDTFLLQIPALLPGEYYFFDETGHTYHEYNAAASVPPTPRADLVAGTAAMPGAPAYADTFTAAPHPILDYTVALVDLTFASGKYRVTALAHIINVGESGPGGGGAHDTSAGINDSNNKLGTITTDIPIPNTVTTINSTAGVVNVGESVTLNVAEANTGTVGLTSPSVELLKNGVLFATLTKASLSYVSGDIDNDGVLDGSDTTAETWIWTLNSGPLIINPTTFQATGHGFDNSTPPQDITWSIYPSERASVPITVLTPNTLVGITANINPLVLPPSGGLVDLTFTEANTGPVALNSPSVTVLKDGLPFAVLVAPPTSGDAAPLGVLGVGETWSWTISNILITTTTTFQATGDATFGNPAVHVTWPDYPTERTNITIVVPPPQEVPASNNLGIGIMIAALAGVMAIFIYRRTRRSQTG